MIYIKFQYPIIDWGKNVGSNHSICWNYKIIKIRYIISIPIAFDEYVWNVKFKSYVLKMNMSS